MRRAGIAFVLLVGCGRLEFGARLDAQAIDAPEIPAIDAAPEICTTEGAACDDLDICTPASTCVGGFCTGEPAGGCTVASSEPEYGQTQGDNGWYYGAWNLTRDTDGIYDPTTDFEMFSFIDVEWRPSDYQQTGPTFTWAYVAPWGGHPGSYPENRLSGRRWVSDVTGHATLVLHLHKADPNGGDGTGLRAFVDGAPVFQRSVAYNDTVGFTENVPIELVVGTRVDVFLDYLGDDGGDTSTWSVRVDSR